MNANKTNRKRKNNENAEKRDRTTKKVSLYFETMLTDDF